MPTMPVVKSVPEYAYEALARQVADFQDNLTPDQEVGISVSGSDSVVHVRSIRQAGQMVVFDGVDNQSRPARLIQHYTQVNVQMIAVDKLHERANRIGFHIDG